VLVESHQAVKRSIHTLSITRFYSQGANKPTLEEMKQTPHHLVSIIEPQVVYNAADWRNDALYVIRKLTGSQAGGEEEERFEPIHKEKMDKFIESTCDTSKYSSILPIVTGGTMMYLQWLVHGFPDAAKPTKEAILRAAEIIQSYQEMDDDDTRYEHGANVVTSNKGWIQAIQYVASLGPIFAQRVLSLSENDWYRLRRTLEVALTALPGAAVPNHHHYIPDDSLQDPSLYMNTPEITNQDTAINTIDSKDRTIQSLYTGQREGGLDTFDFDVRCFFLCPDDRMAHSKIVDRRCEDMILAGLITETTQLYLNGSLPEDGQQTRAIGYRQTLDYLLRSDWKEKDKDAFSNYFNEFTGATRRYSKKQMQWFRKDDAFVFIPISMSEENISARVENAASRIRDLCMQTRQQYESERSSIDSISSETKVQNAKQSDGMKFYLTKRYRIVSGSSDMDRILDEADTCVKMIRSSCIR